MIPQPSNYEIWPGIVRANETAKLTILATENCFIPQEGLEFFLRVHPMNQDGMNHLMEIEFPEIRMSNSKGVLTAEYAFGEEGDYWVDLILDGKVRFSTHVYALEEDLYDLRPLKGDFHGHSYRSDGRRDPGALAGYFREQGYDFFSLTDHNRYYPNGELAERYKDVELGMTFVTGEEIHTPPSVIHIVHVGGKHSVAEIYQKEPERYEAEWRAMLDKVPNEVPEEFRERYAMAMWATDEVHKAGGLAIFAHPFWRSNVCNCYNVPTKYAKLLIKSGMFDAYEVHGGMQVDGNNMSLALWNDLVAEGVRLPIVGSSDVHRVIGSKHFSYLFTIVLAKDNTEEAILDAVRKGYTIPVERSGTPEEPEFRCVGSLRMVIYGQYLLKHYFPRTQRIAEGEGVMMRNYLVGVEKGELLSACADRVPSFWRRFAGIDAPIVPSKEMLERQEKWLAVHRTSPVARGSSIFLNEKGTNIRYDY